MPEEKNAEPSLDVAAYPLAIPLIGLEYSGLVAIVSLLAQARWSGGGALPGGCDRRDHGDQLVLPPFLPIHRCMRWNSRSLQVVGKIIGGSRDRTGRRAHSHGIDRPAGWSGNRAESITHRIIKHGKSTRRLGSHQPTELEPFLQFD